MKLFPVCYKVLYSGLFCSTFQLMIFFSSPGFTSIHSFANDNTLSAWKETVSKLIDTLESESNIALDSFTKKLK